MTVWNHRLGPFHACVVHRYKSTDTKVNEKTPKISKTSWVSFFPFPIFDTLLAEVQVQYGALHKQVRNKDKKVTPILTNTTLRDDNITYLGVHQTYDSKIRQK